LQTRAVPFTSQEQRRSDDAAQLVWQGDLLGADLPDDDFGLGGGATFFTRRSDDSALQSIDHVFSELGHRLDQDLGLDA
jgi:hypothetical protein